MTMQPGLQNVTRRAGALTVLLIVIAILWSTVGRPVLGLVFGGDDLSVIRERIAVLRDDERQLPNLRAKLVDARQKLDADRTLWEPGSAADMSAAMQMQMKHIVGASGGTIRDTADLPWKLEHGFLHGQIRGDLVQSFPELHQTLVALENSVPAMVIDDLAIQPLQSGAPVMEPRLAVSLTLSAYRVDGS